MSDSNPLTSIARGIVDRIEGDFPKNDLLVQQVLCLAEEAGEFVQAARRFMGMARTPGSFEDMKKELADVVLTSYVTAEVFGFSLDLEIANKLTEINDRGGY